MALRLLRDGESTRMTGRIFWIEDLDRAGITYGQLLGFLQDCGLQCVCSPIHNRDRYTPEDVRGWLKRHEECVNKDTGEIAPEFVDRLPRVDDPKKEHVHAYFRSKGPKKAVDWAKTFEEFFPLDTVRWVKVEDWDWAVRYCAHLDAPNKAQYDPATVSVFGNADGSALFDVKKEDMQAALRKCNEQIRNNRYKYFHQLDTWAMSTNDRAIIACVSGRHSYFNAKFVSMRQERMDKQAEHKRKMKAES